MPRQFRLRSLLLFTTILAIWLGIRANRAVRRDVLVLDTMRALGLGLGAEVTVERSRAPWLERLLYADESVKVVAIGFGEIDVNDGVLELIEGMRSLRALKLGTSYHSGITDAGMPHLKELMQLEELYLGSAFHVTAKGLANLSGMKNLRTLDVSYVPVTDDGLKQLSRLTNLESLTVGGFVTTERGLVHLKALTQLRSLNLGCGRIADFGHLKGLPNLKSLTLNGFVTDESLESLYDLNQLTELKLDCPKVTREGITQLREALPNVKVIWQPSQTNLWVNTSLAAETCPTANIGVRRGSPESRAARRWPSASR